MSGQSQRWACEVCGLSGTVHYRAADGVFSIVHAIEDHHERLAHEFAPHCKFDVHRVRVHNPELMDEYAWNRFVATLQRAQNVGKL